MEDEILWQEFVTSVKELDYKPKNYSKPEKTTNKVNIFAETCVSSPATISSARSFEKNDYSNLNKLTIKNFKKFENYVTLDLHGRTLDKSQELFEKFIIKNFALNNRNLLVITGKGNFKNFGYNGKIKNQISKWFQLSTIEPLILTFSDAPNHLGGEGAIMILLRKN